MNYVLVDDEERAVHVLEILLRRSRFFQEGDIITGFTDSEQAYAYVASHPVDVIFLDIEMPVLNGMEFASKMRQNLQHVPDLIFATAYSQYSMDAWNTGAWGYILKPYDPQQLDMILERILGYHQAELAAETSQEHVPEQKLPHMRCFPDFEMLVHQSPISFKSKKSKELLAFLVHNMGNWVAIDKIIYNLLENCEENSSKNYCRTLTYRLKQTLASVGCEDILESKYGELRVVPEKFTCDYYEYLQGRTELFQGEYLEEYEWAESAKATMWMKQNG